MRPRWLKEPPKWAALTVAVIAIVVAVFGPMLFRP